MNIRESFYTLEEVKIYHETKGTVRVLYADDKVIYVSTQDKYKTVYTLYEIDQKKIKNIQYELVRSKIVDVSDEGVKRVFNKIRL